MKTNLIILYGMLSCQLWVATADPPAVLQPDPRMLLYQAAFQQGWNEAVVQSDEIEPDVYAHMLSHEPDGFISIFEYPSSEKATSIFKSRAQGVQVKVGKQSAVRVKQAGMNSLTWQTGSLIFSVTSTKGLPDPWAKQVLLGQYEIMNSVSPAPVGLATPNPVQPPQTTQPPAVQNDQLVVIGDVELNDSFMRMTLQTRGIDKGAVIMIHLRYLRSDQVLEKVPVIVVTSEGIPVKFKAPLLGWPEGQYKIEVWREDQRIGSGEVKINKGSLVK